ncbi:MAG: hypothetical protein JXQ26_02610, partial [Tissierellales bacterium]|nr:hypothetical protein [Tissierellales bacterium]
GNFIQAIRKKSSKLEGKPWEEIEDAETLYLMTPIWASNGVPAINAFLDRADLNEKEVIIITFQQFQDLKDSENVHDYIKNRVIAKNGRVSATYALVGGKIGHFAGEDHIKTQLDQIVN